MRAKLLDGRSQTLLMYDFLCFSVFVLLFYANLIVVYFFAKCKRFFGLFCEILFWAGFPQLWISSLLFYRTWRAGKTEHFELYEVVKTEQPWVDFSYVLWYNGGMYLVS